MASETVMEGSPDQEDNPMTWQDFKTEGNEEFKAGRYAESIQSYSRAIALKSDEASLYSNRSASHLKLRNFNAAMEDAAKCLELDPNYSKGYGRFATAACNLGRFRDAVTMLDRGLAICRSSSTDSSSTLMTELLHSRQQALAADAALTEGRRLLDEGNDQSALRAVSGVAKDFADCFPLAAIIAQARAASNPSGSLATLNGFQSTHSDDPEYHYARALASYYSGNQGMKNAIALLRTALELDPDHAAAKALFKKCREADRLRTAGNDAYAAKKWAEAVEHYTNAINVDPKNKLFNALLHGNRAAARIELKQFTGALSDVTVAINGGQETAKFYARRARIHEQLENWEEAQRDMKRAAEADPSLETEMRNLAKRARLAGRKDWYKILGVTRNATEAEIKRGYRTEAMKWHPDKWSAANDAERSHAEKKFKEVGEAHAILSDPAKRQMYDSGQIDNETDASSGGAARNGFAGGMGGMASEEDVMRMFMGMGGMGGNFGGGGGRRRGPPGGFSFSFGM